MVPRGHSIARAEPRRSLSLRSSLCAASYAPPMRSPKPPISAPPPSVASCSALI
jgi:hypothetical protein